MVEGQRFLQDFIKTVGSQKHKLFEGLTSGLGYDVVCHFDHRMVGIKCTLCIRILIDIRISCL